MELVLVYVGFGELINDIVEVICFVSCFLFKISIIYVLIINIKFNNVYVILFIDVNLVILFIFFFEIKNIIVI